MLRRAWCMVAVVSVSLVVSSQALPASGERAGAASGQVQPCSPFWSVRSAANSGLTSPTLFAISGTGPTNIWAVGQTNSAPLAEHWDGSQWTVSSPDAVGISSQLFSVATPGQSEVWAVGLSSPNDQTLQPLIEHRTDTWSASQ